MSSVYHWNQKNIFAHSVMKLSVLGTYIPKFDFVVSSEDLES